MKFFGVVLFIVAMNWTWSLVHESRGISEAVHVGIQNDMKKIIGDYIAENLPTSTNLEFHQFWTEKLKKNQVKVKFSYSFEDSTAEIGAARVNVEGYAVLNKVASADAKYETWSFDELQILDNKVEFKEPLKVSPGDDTGETDSE